MNVNLTPNITGKNVNIIKGATQADLTNSVNNSKTYRDEAEAFSIVSEAKSVEASYSALNASISSTTASDKATIATTKANEANNSANSASASETVCIAKATIATDNADIAIAQAVIATNKATEANTSANTANTQANIAITKASEASISASNALTSENNADTSEANALIYRNQAESFANSINPSDLVHISGTETITGNKTFSGTVSGLTKATVGLSNVDNTSDSAKNVLYATTAGTASANDVYAWAKASVKPTYTASEVGLGNVTNESKATMFTNSTLTGTVTLPSTTSIGTISSTELGYLDGVTFNIQNQLDSKNPNLVSGTNIKTINSSTILGSGNINLVNLTTDQTIDGIKTFTSSPIVPTPTTYTQAVNKEYVDSKPTLSIGAILNGYTIFENCIVAFGGEFNRADYPKLWAYLQANPSLVKAQAEWTTENTTNGMCGYYSSGNGTTTFRVPNLDKAFLRPDSRSIASYQSDAIRNIVADWGNVFIRANTGNDQTGAAVKLPLGEAIISGPSIVATKNSLQFNASLVVPTSNENRPKNISVLPLIVAK